MSNFCQLKLLTRNTFTAPGHLTCIQFNKEDPNILGGACENGQVSLSYFL